MFWSMPRKALGVVGVFLQADDIVDLGQPLDDRHGQPELAGGGVVVYRDADIDSLGDRLKVADDAVGGGHGVVRRDYEKSVRACGLGILGEFDGVAGAGAAGADHDGELAVYFLADDVDDGLVLGFAHGIELARGAERDKDNVLALESLVLSHAADALAQRRDVEIAVFIEGSKGEMEYTLGFFFHFLRLE